MGAASVYTRGSLKIEIGYRAIHFKCEDISPALCCNKDVRLIICYTKLKKFHLVKRLSAAYGMRIIHGIFALAAILPLSVS